MSCDTFVMTTDTSQVTLHIPETLSWTEGRNQKTIHFWEDTSVVIDTGKDIEQITLAGVSKTADIHNSSITDVYEYNMTYNTFIGVYSDNWKAQGFTIGTTQFNENFYMTQARLLLERDGNPSHGTVAIKSLLAGADLASSTINGNIVPDGLATWITFTFSPALLLHSNSLYYLIFKTDGTGTSDDLDWYYSNTPVYGGGTRWFTPNGGINWFQSYEYDNTFIIEGYSENIFWTMKRIDKMMDEGEEITISGFNNDFLDTTWLIEDFTYSREPGTPSVVFWNLTLEKT